MSRLNKLIEQTSYLLLKQGEAQKETASLFENVLSFIEKEAEKKPEAHKNRLIDVCELLAGRAETLNNYAQEDIDFLQDQLKALKSIQGVKDPKAAAEMLEALVDSDEEVSETEDFKHALDEELSQSKEVLITVIDEIKEAVERNDIKETEILIEGMIEAEEMDDEDDDDYDDEDEDEDDEEDDKDEKPARKKKASGCGDCSGGCGPSGGCSSKGGSDDGDIFSFMSNYDRALNNDLEEEDEDDDCCDDDKGGCCDDDKDEADE